MGVPAFFRWLSRKYPSVIIECVEEKQFAPEGSEVKVPIDTTKPNPNGIEFDNLYLDMNGIIHPCTHPEDKPAPKDEDEMMVAIFECIDRLFAIVRPRKLLYMAIDGVAPRAKMNQQRSRRFRAAKESQERKDELKRVREELISKGYKVPPEKPKEIHFDSNCITPGTPFMDRLSKCLHYYIHDRLNSDPGWANIKIILSDANCPGEGEHKIMDFIRKQRAQPDHDPNTQHVLCGADADLIMLGLATHEPNFTIIREEFKPNKDKPCEICGLNGHELKECEGLPDEAVVCEKVYDEVRFIFVRLNVLREYLERELDMPNLPFKFDFDRALDDWVFMCFFVGNDFLPHLPSLEIRENAIDRLIKLYKNCCYKTGGWLTDSGKVNMKRVQMIMENLGRVEDEIFKTRQKRELDFKARNKMRRKSEQMEKEAANMYKNITGQGALGVMRVGETTAAHGAREAISQQRSLNMQMKKGVKRPFEEDPEDEEPPDEVRLYEDGFKERYYESKFEVSSHNTDFRQLVANEYAIGLCWVLKYYYQGCASWKWYFPYHYAPFASDFGRCGDVEVIFDLGTPFNPLEQLMGVFPAASRSHVPEPWGELMLDPESDIIDFYPEDFKIDLNGKRFAWQGVALLPFVDETRLKRALTKVYDQLTEEEKRRNVRGDDRLYLGPKHKAHRELIDMYRMGMSYDTEVPMGGKQYEGMGGLILLAGDCVGQDESLCSPVVGLEDVEANKVVCVKWRDPKYSEGFIFSAKKLPGAKEPPRVLKPGQLNEQDNRNYRPMIGFNKNMPRASLGNFGHRAINHYTGNSGNEGNFNNRGNFNEIAPPQNYGNRNRGGGSWGGSGRGGMEGRGGRGGRGGGRWGSDRSHQNQDFSHNSGSLMGSYKGGAGSLLGMPPGTQMMNQGSYGGQRSRDDGGSSYRGNNRGRGRGGYSDNYDNNSYQNNSSYQYNDSRNNNNKRFRGGGNYRY